MGIALDDRTVHEGAGIALVGVADDIALVRLVGGAEAPLQAGRKTAAAAAAQTGIFNGDDHLFGAHCGQGLFRRGVAADAQIIGYRLRIDLAQIRQNDLGLVVMEDMVVVSPQPFGHRLSADDMILNQSFHHLRLNILIGRNLAADTDIDQDIPGTESAAAHLVEPAALFNLGIFHSGGLKLLLEGRHHHFRTGCDATGAHAHIDNNFAVHGLIPYRF